MSAATRWTVALGAAAALAGAPQARPAGCPPAGAVTERVLSGDCEACWAGADRRPAAAWVLDWIAPGLQGHGAALAAAALPEAQARQVELAATSRDAAPRAAAALRRDWTLPPRGPVRLEVSAGPAWNGYVGLELRSRGRPPRGARAYLALVELVPAGSEGTPVARGLVRAVAGPLALASDGAALSTLRALRLPEAARPERLRGMAWWVDARGRLRGIAREDCPS